MTKSKTKSKPVTKEEDVTTITFSPYTIDNPILYRHLMGTLRQYLKDGINIARMEQECAHVIEISALINMLFKQEEINLESLFE